MDFDEPTTSHKIIDEDIITEGEEVIIVPLGDEDTSILEAEKVIEPSVNKRKYVKLRRKITVNF